MRAGFQTRRLVVAPLAADELPDALSAYASRPEHLALVEGSAAEPGRYDLAMLERDWAIAQATPGRVFAGIRLRASGELVGVLDWLDPNPADGLPWVGLVLVAAAHGRRGYAREAVEGLLAHTGWTAVREGVIAGNEAGLALARALGFRPLERRTQTLPGGPTTVLVLERRQ